MTRMLLTLLLFSANSANAEPVSILNLLYKTDNLTFLDSNLEAAMSNPKRALSQDQARSLAADLNASLVRDNPEDPIYLAKRLANVGVLQTYAGDLIAGDQSLRAALSQFNQNGGLFDPRLPSLLSAIGINGFLRKDYDTAEDHFRWSQNIQHRSQGLFAAEQSTNLNWLTRTYLSTGQTDAADTAQRYLLRIAEHVLPAGSLALSNIKISLAGYLGQRAHTISPFAEELDRLLRQTLFNDSIELLNQAILEITAAEGSYSAKLIGALETKSQVYSWQGRSRRSQEQALEQILTIIQNQPVVDPEALSNAWFALADGYILTGNKKAKTAYRAAWLAANPVLTIAEADPSANPNPNSDSEPSDVVTDPVLLWPDAYKPIYFDAVVDSGAPSDTQYAVHLQFRISTEGRVKRIKVLSENVPHREVRLTRTLILNSRYRPALRNGIPEEVAFSLSQPFIRRSAPAPTADASLAPVTDADPLSE